MTAQTFPRDHHLRRALFVEESFQHKARTNLFWLAWLLDQHTAADEIVLDPMGGTGSILLATTKQRPILSGDLEPHWVRLQRQNALRIQTETLFNRPAYITQWTATNLPLTSGAVPAIVTSPPYFDLFSDWNRKHGSEMDGNPDHIGETGNCYGFSAGQIGNIHVYENYLRTMRQVYRECWRVLRPGGTLVLIVGDKVRKGRIVPVTADTLTLCLANSFRLTHRHQRRTIPSHFRLIHKQRNGDDYPLIDKETALVFQKTNKRQPQFKQHFAIIEAPSPNSSPGRQLFDKQLEYITFDAQPHPDHILKLTKQGLINGHAPNVIWSDDHASKARTRREWSYQIVADLVTKYGLTAGDTVNLHVTDRYARYLQQRLNTLGARATIPTARCNFGQKLTWYTKRIDTETKKETDDQ